MKLRDKEGTVQFHVKDADTGETWTAKARAYLTRRQANKMSGQPDQILQFAHYLARVGRKAGRRVEVRAVTSTSVNGREPQPLIDPEVDLAAQPRNMRPASWIVPLHQPLRKAARHSTDVDE
jgi:hypothetical protein